MNVQQILERQWELTAERMRRSLQGLTPEDLIHRPDGLAPILWQVGHVALYDAILLERSGEPVNIPPSYNGLFREGTDGSGILPPLNEVRDFFEVCQAEVLRVAAAGDFDRPASGPNDVYVTVGEGLIRMLYHRGYHQGKIWTLRALVGKPE